MRPSDRIRLALEGLLQFRYDGKQIADKANVSHFEDGRILVFVNGDDRSGVLDPG